MSSILTQAINKLIKIGDKAKGDAVISNTSWLNISHDTDEKIVCIFKLNGELLNSVNGDITKGKWEFVVDGDSLVLENENKIELYNAILIKDDFLLLQKDNSNFIIAFANLTKFKDHNKSKLINAF
jgi:hypothetical protein